MTATPFHLRDPGPGRDRFVRGPERGGAAGPVRRWAGFALDRPLVMGILNVTPDSFADGGRFLDARLAIAEGERLLAAGADLVDVGGESTRPGAVPVGAAEEQARILPVIAALARTGAVLSVDTYHAETMARALDAGARIVNDITALAGDPASLATVAGARCPVILMHMAGRPATMQDAPAYRDVVSEVHGFLVGRLATAAAAGLPVDRIALDPGIGFGKTAEHNLALLRQLPRIAGIGRPVVVGVSRKRMIAALSKGEDADHRLGGSLALALGAVERQAAVLRVHDVAQTVQALALWRALKG